MNLNVEFLSLYVPFGLILDLWKLKTYVNDPLPVPDSQTILPGARDNSKTIRAISAMYKILICGIFSNMKEHLFYKLETVKNDLNFLFCLRKNLAARS